MKEKIALLAAVGVALLAMAGMYRHIENARRAATGEDETLSFVVAARDLPAGATLAPEDLATARFPRRTRPSSAVGGESLDLLASRTLLRARRAGEPILWLDLPEGGDSLACRVPAGERAITIAVSDTSGLSGHLRPRDRVDVFGILPASEGTGTSGRVARLLLTNVTVLAVGTSTAEGSWDLLDAYATATLAVKPAEAQLLALAQQEGDLVLALRHPQDVAGLDPTELPDVRSEHLYAPERLAELVRQQRERVAIYKSGLPEIE